ncbi:MAG: hypothetical protein WA784_13000 [Albidovulum sp.]|jgi:hypothetical protein
MTAALPVASLWIGDRLSYIEITVLKSFMAQGHEVTLFTLGPVADVPDGVILRDAQEFGAPEFDFSGLTRRFAAGVYSDVFRIDLLAQTDFIWADLDAYCVRRLEPIEGYLVGTTNPQKLKPNNGVLRLPRASEALRLIRDFLHDPNPIPWWFPERRKAFRLAKKASGLRWGIETFKWSVSGPLILNKALHRTGEVAHVLPQPALYPVNHNTCVQLLDPKADHAAFETPETLSVHLFGATKLHLIAEHDGLPPTGSYIDTICKRHDVDPAAFPLAAGTDAAELVADPDFDAAILARGAAQEDENHAKIADPVGAAALSHRRHAHTAPTTSALSNHQNKLADAAPPLKGT